MLREQAKFITRAHKFLDICLTAAAFIAAYFIKRLFLPASLRGLSVEPNYYIVLLMIIIIWYVSFGLFELYASYRKQSFGEIFRNMLKAVSAGMLVMSLCMYVFKITDISRIMLGIFFLLNIGLLSVSKGFVYLVLARYRKKGYNSRNILIVGTRQRAVDVIDAIGDRLGSGYSVLGCLGIDEAEIGKKIKNGIKVIGTVDHLEKILRDQVVDELIFAMPLKKIEDANKYIALAEEVGVSVRIVPDWQIHKLMYHPKIASIQFEEFLGVSTLTMTTTSTKQGDLFIKSTFDYAFAAVTLVLSVPFFIAVALAIKITSKGPVFFKQERSGLNGRLFKVYKFRTMVLDAELKQADIKEMNESDGPVFKIRKDPRIIPCLGGFLRKTGMDELPQLVNVLKGEMSLIGPRPPIPAEVEKYETGQRRRLSMKPGITCLWQVTPDRNETTFDVWMQMDLEYIDNWSLWLDFKIFWKTILVMLTGSGR